MTVDNLKSTAHSHDPQPSVLQRSNNHRLAVHPEVVTAMREVGIDLSRANPRYLSKDVTKDAHIVITMGCGEECPLIPGVERDDWPLDDPKGQPAAVVRSIRDEIRKRVAELVKERKWG